MSKLSHKIPPPIVAALFGLVMWGLAFLEPSFELLSLSFTLRAILALALVLIGLFFCVSGVISFRKAKTTVNPLRPETASALVTSGIYQVTRNPMYLGFCFILAAWSLYLASVVSLIGVIGYMFYIQTLQIVPEELALITLFGEEFKAYQSEVRRWI